MTKTEQELFHVEDLIFDYYRQDKAYALFPSYDRARLRTDIAYAYQIYEQLYRYTNHLIHRDTFTQEQLIDVYNTLYNLHQYAYNEFQKREGNWWYWTIGIPNVLLKTLMTVSRLCKGGSGLIELYSGALNKFLVPMSKSDLTYANQASVCRNMFIYGILLKDDNMVEKALNRAIPAFRTVDKCSAELGNSIMKFLVKNRWFPAKTWMTAGKEGLYEDGTFIQHTAIPYMGTYGIEVLEFAALISTVCVGTKYQLSDKITTNLPLWIKAAKLCMFDGQVMLPYCGRAVADVQVERNAMLINKYIHEIEALIGVQPDIANGLYMQPHGDIAQLRTDSWCVIIKCSSDRIARYESFNNQNASGWNQGGGVTYVYHRNDDQFSNTFYQAINPNSLPGITRVTSQLRDVESKQPLFDYQSDEIDKLSCTMHDQVVEFDDELCHKEWQFKEDRIHCSGHLKSWNRLSVDTIIDSRIGDFMIYVVQQDENGTLSLHLIEDDCVLNHHYDNVVGILVDGVAFYGISLNYRVVVNYSKERYTIYIEHDEDRMDYQYTIIPTD